MVNAAAAADGVFFEGAPAGGGFARVDDAGRGGGEGVGVAAGEGGDAGEALDEVERGTLGGEQRGGGPATLRTRAPFWTRAPSVAVSFILSAGSTRVKTAAAIVRPQSVRSWRVSMNARE